MTNMGSTLYGNYNGWKIMYQIVLRPNAIIGQSDELQINKLSTIPYIKNETTIIRWET